MAVLGGGISGLTAAYRLLQDGHEVALFDRRTTPGGRIHTERRDGFLVEHGPHSMISPAQGTESLIESLGLAEQRIDKGNAVRHRYLVRDGRTHALPVDPLRFFSSRFFTLRGRLRLLAEPFIGKGPADESVADFVRRRFGRELLDYVFDPLVGGLYAGNPENLSMAALLPRLKQLETAYGSVVRGVMNKAVTGIDPRYDPRRRTLFSFRQGMAALPHELATALGSRLRYGTRIDSVYPLANGKFQLSYGRGDERTAGRLHVDGVVVALPAYAAAKVLASLHPEVGESLATIQHPPLAVVALGYRRDHITHPLDGLGVLTPTVERRNILGFLFSSTLFIQRAPDGHVLLTAYVGGARQPELAQLPREELIGLVRTEAGSLLGAEGNPVFESVRYWRHGLPQPNLGHAARLETLRALERQYPGLVVTGNYVAGVSTTACIDSAIAAVERIVERPILADLRADKINPHFSAHVFRID